MRKFVNYIEPKIIRGDNTYIDLVRIERIFMQNEIFTNLLAKNLDAFNIVYVSAGDNTISNTKFTEIKNAITNGPTIIFSHNNNQDVDQLNQVFKGIEQPVLNNMQLNFSGEGIGESRPIFEEGQVRRYTQNNLTRLTYKLAKEKMANLDEYTLRVGKSLEIDFHSNVIKIDVGGFIAEGRTYSGKLDTSLIYLPLMQELSTEEKQQIIEGLPLKNLQEAFEREERKKALIEMKKTLTEGYKSKIEDQIINANREIEQYQRYIDEHIQKIEQLRHDRFLLITEGKNDAFEKFFSFIERSPHIHKVKIRASSRTQYIDIFTQPMYLNYYDEERAKRILPNIVPNSQLELYKEAFLEKKYKVGVGRYRIHIEISNAGCDIRAYKMHSRVQNRHVDINCLGTFSNPVNEARRSYDLFKLVNLYLQFIQTVSFGDSAGDDTVRNKIYIANSDGKILYSPHGYTNEKEIQYSEE